MILSLNGEEKGATEMTQTKQYTVIGTPRIETDYSDEFETTMVIDLRRADGVEGDVWIVAGVPDFQQGSSKAAGHQSGFECVRVYGDSPAAWCPDSFTPEDGDYADVAGEIIEAVEAVALATHRERRDADPDTEIVCNCHGCGEPVTRGKARYPHEGGIYCPGCDDAPPELP